MIKRLFLFLSIIVLAVGCRGTVFDDHAVPEGSVRFNFSILGGSIDESTRAFVDSTSDKITHLQYVILDAEQNIMDYPKSKLFLDKGLLIIDQLKDGNYTLVVYATTSKDKTPIEPKVKDGRFMIEAREGEIFDQDQLYAKVDFAVGKDNNAREIPVTLWRCVGIVQLEIKPSDQYTHYMIQSVSLRFADQSSVYTQYDCSIAESLSGSMAIDTFDMTTKRGFYSLPSVAPLSGEVFIVAKDDSGKIHQSKFLFENFVIEPGKASTIDIDWISPINGRGLVKVFKRDLDDSNFKTMFARDEPREVFYDERQRSMRTNRPVEVFVNAKKQLQIKSYAGVDLSDVTIQCRFRKLSGEYFDLANFETIPAFSDISIDMPVASRPVTFVSSDGKHILIDTKGAFSDNNCDFKIVTDHPYMAKIAKIKYPIYVSFSPYGADEGHPNWTHMDPDVCRQGCIWAVNLSYIFSSEEFVQKIEGWPKSSTTHENANPLLGNQNEPLSAERVIADARAVKRLVMGATGNGVGGLAGAHIYGLAHYIYYSHYWDSGDVLLGGREKAIHEFGHCMGYGHEGTMTYGDGFTRAMQEVIHELGKVGGLPVSNRNWASNYPNN